MVLLNPIVLLDSIINGPIVVWTHHPIVPCDYWLAEPNYPTRLIKAILSNSRYVANWTKMPLSHFSQIWSRNIASSQKTQWSINETKSCQWTHMFTLNLLESSLLTTSKICSKYGVFNVREKYVRMREGPKNWIQTLLNFVRNTSKICPKYARRSNEPSAFWIGPIF